MGIVPAQTTPLAEVGAFYYHADDPDTGRVEDEWDHVLVATLTSGVPEPDESEVQGCRWADPGRLRAALAAFPVGYTPWLTGVLDIATADRSHGKSTRT
jgi:isopentenyl-diphosphate delta-isomerase